ncbi:MAG: hypothetical protein ACK5NG_08960 [Chthoniobacterales bacterium]
MKKFFSDVRWRQERLFVFIVLPIIVVLCSGFLFFLLYDDIMGTPKVIIEDDPYLGELAPLALVKAADEEEAAPEFVSEPEEAVVADPLNPPEPDQEKSGTDSDTDPSTNLTLGMQAMTTGDIERAKYYLATAKNEDGEESSQLYTLIGSVAMAENAAGRAITSFSKAIELDDTNEAAFWARSEALRRLGRLDEAMKDLERAQELMPASILFNNKIYLLRLEMGEVEKIKKELEEKKNLDLTTLEPSWLAAAAALEFIDEKFDAGINQLAKLQKNSSTSDFRLIISDRVILFFASNPKVREYLNQYARTQGGGDNSRLKELGGKLNR